MTYTYDLITLGTFTPQVHVGATADERAVLQTLDIDIELAVEIARARNHDDLRDTLDYAQMHSRLTRLLAVRPFILIEHVAEVILREIVSAERVLHAKVAIRKPGILGGATPGIAIYGRRATRVAIGLGGNLGDVPAAFTQAVAEIGSIARLECVSSLYVTDPWGQTDQPRFFNAALLLYTHLMPHALLAFLKRLEIRLGRRPGPRFGPRAIDLDLLVDDGAVLADAELVLPHPRLFERAFALTPLAEIDTAYAPALSRLPEDDRASVRRVAEWPTWSANRPLL